MLQVAFSVVRAAQVAMQLCGKHIFAAVNQHPTIEEGVFCGTTSRLNNENLTQLELELT
jgi:hypothetical protein